MHPFRSCSAWRHGAQAAAPAQRRQWQRVGAAERESATPESLTAVQELDALIDALLAKKGAQELAQAVAGVRSDIEDWVLSFALSANSRRAIV